MAEDRFLLDSPAIEKAVAFHNSADYPPRRPGKNSLDDVPAMGSSGYNGMFAVKRDENGIYVSPGYTDLGKFEGGYLLDGDEDNAEMFVLLVRRVNSPRTFSVRTSISQNGHYVAGETMSWALAYIDIDKEIKQLYTQGIINFSERYFV